MSALSERPESPPGDVAPDPPPPQAPPCSLPEPDPAVSDLLARVAVRLPWPDGAMAARGRCILRLPPPIAGRPAIVAAVAARGLQARLVVAPGEPALFDPGPFALADFEAAVGSADPLAALARRRPDGEDAVAALACRRVGLRWHPLPADAAVLSRRSLPSRATSTLRAAVFEVDGRPTTVVAPPLDDIAAFGDGFASQPGVLVTTPRRLERALRGAVAGATLERTTGLLEREAPMLSAARAPSPPQRAGIVLAGLVVLAGTIDLVPWLSYALLGSTAVAFLALAAMRLQAGLDAGAPLAPPAVLPDADLPPYTVLVALYHEDRMVAALAAALDALDYPADRKEVLFLVESDDRATTAAAEVACQGRPGFRTIVVPDGRPRTKPRALAYGLAFATGEIVTVYDAEDRPDRDQLRRAAAALLAGPDHLACVQARLEIDRTAVALQRQFAIEYACLFDGLLPFLGRHRLPLPLGGTSNHFKRRALEVAGGWDPFNVTEDADLGIRLARFGYSCDVVDSTTLEEAPARVKVWLRQRVRWIKGWLMTWLVHMRRPVRLGREMGVAPMIVLQLHMTATVLSALLHPVGLTLIALHATGAVPLPHAESLPGAILVTMTVGGLAGGYLGNLWLARRILRRRGRRSLLPGVWLMPLYWLLASLAAWIAVVDLLRRPHYWAKTPHRHGEAAADAAGADGSDGKETLERVKGIEPSS